MRRRLHWWASSRICYSDLDTRNLSINIRQPNHHFTFMIVKVTWCILVLGLLMELLLWFFGEVWNYDLLYQESSQCSKEFYLAWAVTCDASGVSEHPLITWKGHHDGTGTHCPLACKNCVSCFWYKPWGQVFLERGKMLWTLVEGLNRNSCRDLIVANITWKGYK